MNKKEEKELIEEYLRCADGNARPKNTDDPAPLPDIPTDLPTSTAGDSGDYVKV